MIFLGINEAFLFIPVLPECIERLQVDMNVGSDREDSLNDVVNDAFSFVCSLAYFTGPIIGDSLF